MAVGTSALSAVASFPVVLLIAPGDPHHDHTRILADAGFRIITQSRDDASVKDIIDLDPRIVIAELSDGAGTDAIFNLVRRLKAHHMARHIPLIVYGTGLTADQIETTAHAGAMWLQLEPRDGYKLLAAVRGVLRA